VGDRTANGFVNMIFYGAFSEYNENAMPIFEQTFDELLFPFGCFCEWEASDYADSHG
jgi:hypothetical protein